jgi:hypothetical protein
MKGMDREILLSEEKNFSTLMIWFFEPKALKKIKMKK